MSDFSGILQTKGKSYDVAIEFKPSVVSVSSRRFILEGRGIERLRLVFKDSDFHGLDIHKGWLQNFNIFFVSLLTFVFNGEAEELDLKVMYEFGRYIGGGIMNKEALKLGIILNGNEYSSSGSTPSFLAELRELENALKLQGNVNACFNCRLSGVNPFTEDYSGSILCFRAIKSTYYCIQDEGSYIEATDFSKRVYENFLCNEYERLTSEDKRFFDE
ncbi:hypothetical protein [Acanthopleuribacter pedis]|uniref:Uncharacterized protein n=1 Tax=Acanthopleuribacter pedis TaxID=442870 RepID=A0A8J7QKZ7_9BACT|nr:hypothetical protein [Acanthopleuribacter pedis]MBO1321830.1 hypothetical protein [Acanthopleuribacter pedis]